MAQVGSKVGPEMRKVARQKMFKEVSGVSMCVSARASQDDPKRTPNGPLRPKRTSRRAQEDVKTAQVTCQMVKVTCQGFVTLSR